MNDNYENYLIREMTTDWSLDRIEATADWFDHDFPAVPVLAEAMATTEQSASGEARESTSHQAAAVSSRSRGGRQNLQGSVHQDSGEDCVASEAFPASSELPAAPTDSEVLHLDKPIARIIYFKDGCARRLTGDYNETD